MWKIALVDDDFQVLDGLRSIIPWEELDAEFAGDAIDGEEGLKLIEEVNPDIVITDIYMPMMNGIEMIERLRARKFPGRFIILSGYNDFEFARSAIRMGVEDYLTKPVTVEQVHQVLAATIEKLEDSYLNSIEQTKLSRRDNAGEPASEEDWLKSVIVGAGSMDSLQPAPEDWRDSRPIVLVLELTKTERVKGISVADWNLFKFAITNIACEILERDVPKHGFAWLYGNHAAVVLDPDHGMAESERLEECRRIGHALVEEIGRYLDLKLRYSLGEPKSSWRGLRESADEALKRLLTEDESNGAGQEEAPVPVLHQKHRKAIEFMIEYVHENYAEDITLEDLASRLFISKNYLNQLFKKTTGETFTNYVIRVRIEKAKALLSEGKYLIYEVSEMVGYQNVPYFSTLFKKYCGVSPSDLFKNKAK